MNTRAAPPARRAKSLASRAAGTFVVPWVLLLSGCGGGLYIEIGDDGFDDPPSVNLVSSVTSATPGQVVRLSAAASDDDRVDQVAFYRVEPNGERSLLGADAAAPFDWDAVVPNDGRGTVRYVARATDSRGQRTESDAVAVNIVR